MKTRPFDAGNVPLTGAHLVEASAGTGKTFSITSLVLRLVAEQGLTVDQVLVVTFTNAATAELKDRIRKRLRQAQLQLERGELDDATLLEIVEKAGDGELVLQRIVNALRELDGAAVFTIHGFCRRVLQENAFESGSLFDTELVTEQTELLQEAVDDFWRVHVTRQSPDFLAYLEEKKAGPDTWLAFARDHTGAHRREVIPRTHLAEPDDSEAAYADAVQAFRSAWEKDRDRMEAVLTEESLSKGKYKPSTVEKLVAEVDQWLALPGAALPAKFELLTQEKLLASLKKGYAAPRNPIFERGSTVVSIKGRLDERHRTQWIALRAALLEDVDTRLQLRKAQLNVQFFDDLLTRLDHALADRDGAMLAARIRAQYPAALIDEFQDTDPVQYRIFRTLYGGREQACLFLVGDPKQSIYAFRGADIFSYLQARSLADSIQQLSENWRSSKGLVAAVGALFGHARRPFLFDTIPFEASTAAKGSAGETASLQVPGGNDAPMQMWFMRREEVGKPTTKGRAEPRVLASMASEAARLIDLGAQKKARIGDRPLEPGDLAVLVRTHRQAAEVKAALAACGVAGVMSGEHSVFDSDEAAQLERVLHAIARPSDEGLIRGALLTPLYGLSANALLELEEDTRAWEERVASFAAYHRFWRAEGFVQMFRRWLTEEEVPPRLLGTDDGERRLTNLLHLGELLEKASLGHPAGPEGLVGWLSDHRAHRGDTTAEEAELRLESDARRVRIVTIHKSKGLEYPVVFLPFAYDGGRGGSDSEVVFHDRDQDFSITLDLGSPAFDEHKAWAEEEDRAEQLRLLYVAVTRASHRCYLAWGRINKTETSALGYLLHQSDEMDASRLAGATAERIKGITDPQMLEDLGRLSSASEGGIQVLDLDSIGHHTTSESSASDTKLTARTFTGRIDRSWRMASFTALASGRHADADRPDRDPLASGETAPETERTGSHALPGGVATGTLLHKVFEDLAFDADAETVQRVVARRTAYGPLGAEWQPVLCDMVMNTLHTPLDGESPALTLAGVTEDRRLNELEFHLPLGRITPAGLGKLLPGHGDAAARGLTGHSLVFEPVRGFMKGYIDLVFEHQGRYYLLDYKSNRLGRGIESYERDRLPDEMRASHYDLQYHLYAVALHRHLAVRKGDTYRCGEHFGGVYYLFLRGMHPDQGPTHGVFFDRPDPARIEELSAYLEQGEAL